MKAQAQTQGQPMVINPGRPVSPRYYQAARMFPNEFGVKQQTHQDPQTGQVFTTTTFPQTGRVETTAMRVGRQPEDIARSKQLAVGDAKSLEKLNDSISAQEARQGSLQVVSNQLANLNVDPNEVTGPVQSVINRIGGSRELQDALGTLASSTGEISISTAEGFKGAFTGGQRALINQVKANVSDPFPIFLAKLRSMQMMNNFVLARQRAMANYLEQGYSRSKAGEMAQKTIPFERAFEKVVTLKDGRKIGILGTDRYVLSEGEGK